MYISRVCARAHAGLPQTKDLVIIYFYTFFFYIVHNMELRHQDVYTVHPAHVLFGPLLLQPNCWAALAASRWMYWIGAYWIYLPIYWQKFVSFYDHDFFFCIRKARKIMLFRVFQQMPFDFYDFFIYCMVHTRQFRIGYWKLERIRVWWAFAQWTYWINDDQMFTCVTWSSWEAEWSILFDDFRPNQRISRWISIQNESGK